MSWTPREGRFGQSLINQVSSPNQVSFNPKAMIHSSNYVGTSRNHFSWYSRVKMRVTKAKEGLHIIFGKKILAVTQDNLWKDLALISLTITSYILSQSMRSGCPLIPSCPSLILSASWNGNHPFKSPKPLLKSQPFK